MLMGRDAIQRVWVVYYYCLLLKREPKRMQYEYKTNNESALILCVPYFQLHENQYNDMVLVYAMCTHHHHFL